MVEVAAAVEVAVVAVVVVVVAVVVVVVVVIVVVVMVVVVVAVVAVAVTVFVVVIVVLIVVVVVVFVDAVVAAFPNGGVEPLYSLPRRVLHALLVASVVYSSNLLFTFPTQKVFWLGLQPTVLSQSDTVPYAT